MISIAICDDDNRILEDISAKVRTTFECHNIQAKYACFNDPRVLMKKLINEPLDVLFLDIDMPYFSGMDIAGFINEKEIKTLIVFVTSHDALVYETFKYRPFGFIRKTHIDEEINELVKRIDIELRNNQKELIIKKGQDIERLPIKDIVYVEAEGNYLNIRTTAGEIRIRETLSALSEELLHKGFIRCHKGYLVNIDRVNRIKGAELEVSQAGENICIPIGRNYEKEVRRKILETMR